MHFISVGSKHGRVKVLKWLQGRVGLWIASRFEYNIKIIAFAN